MFGSGLRGPVWRMESHEALCRSLAPRWRDLSEDDLDCCAAFVVARKR